jgi:serine/threonine protein phosphatase 1
MKTYIIGDVHGCYDELIELTQKINLQDEDLLISVGDIVDRGNKSLEVYKYFKYRPNSIVLMGNHERKHQYKILSYAQEIVKVQFGNEYEAFLNWLPTLPYYYETHEAIIVHAFFEHDKALQHQKEEVLCGSTSGSRYLEIKYPPETYWSDYYRGAMPIIYGHHVVGDFIKNKNNTYGIDTGACHGNYLTAIELPGFIVHQVKAKKDYWKEEQKLWQIPVLKAKPWNDMQFHEIDKYLNRLSFSEDTEVIKYLLEIKQWKEGLENSYDEIKIGIDNFTQNLMKHNATDFNTAASAYKFRHYIFKSKAKTLNIQELKVGLNTPNKILEIREQIGI